MKKLNYKVDLRSNEFKPTFQIKNDGKYLEATAKAIEALEQIGKDLEEFTDDFDIRSAYNQMYGAYSKLKIKHEIAKRKENKEAV